MNGTPIVPARLAFDAHGVPFSAEYRDIYHPRSGAASQARHVFLAGSELPRRWQRRSRFVLLETGFGLGNNFLATWQAWRDDPARCERLVFVSVERHPLARDDLAAVHRGSPWPDLANALLQAWPPLTHNLHRLAFDAGRVELLLALGDVQTWLPELIVEADAFYLDGFAPASNPRMWDDRVCKALGRLAAPEATLATWSAAHRLRTDLTTAGFEVRLAAGQGGKRDITLARFTPTFAPRRAPSRAPVDTSVARHALIVGAGLAGCAAAWALAEQGWHSTLFDRAGRIASAASGQPAGLFHGIVNAQDGTHARFNRAAAIEVYAAVRIAIAEHRVAGGTRGLLRLESGMTQAEMTARSNALGLPDDYVQALDAEAASRIAGVELDRPCWFFRQAGWVDPGGLARSFVERAGAHARWVGDVDVQRLERSDDGWRLLDAAGRTLAEAQTVVLANAGDAMRLLGMPGWPIDDIRGQISAADAAHQTAPDVPITGSGYLLPAIGGRVLFGATAQPDDRDPSVRIDDHRLNVARLERLMGRPAHLDANRLEGRTAWRCRATDRLPLIGAVPADAAPDARIDQPRFVPRRPGLFMFAALASRGITWSALGARVLAACVSGAPMPVEASLLDAVDPARFVSRRARRLCGSDTAGGR